MISNEPSVLFIGGTGRCGSSILRKALGQHALCGVLPFEHRFLIDPDGVLDFYSSYHESWSPYNYDLRLKRLSIFLKSLSGNRIETTEKTDWLLSEEQYKGWNLKEVIPNFDNYIDELLDQLIDFKFDANWVGGKEPDGEQTIWFSKLKETKTIREKIQIFSWKSITSLISNLSKSIYVEDNTWNLLYAKQLLDIFPNAKFVHIYRNPLDVISSYISQNWCPDDVMQSALFYASLMDRWHQVQKTIPDESYLEISFEDYVARPEDIYKKICNHMGINFETSMLNVEILSSPIGKWKEKINNDMHQPLKERLKFYIEKYDY